jgi:hypothetical protein
MWRILLLLCVYSVLQAQTEFPLVRIFEAQSRLGASEPSICVDPSDPSRIVAGSVLNDVHTSNDSGKTWTSSVIRSEHGVYGDPCLIADGRGSFYFLHLGDASGTGWGGAGFLDRMVCQRSDDGGRTWNNGSYLGHRPPHQQDKEWAVADPGGSRLYSSWTEFDRYGSSDSSDHSRILFSFSTDRAESWSAAQTLSSKEGDCLDGDQTTEGAVPAAGPHGEVYVSWSLDEKIWFNRSLDEGNSWWPQERPIAAHSGGWSQEVSSYSRINGMPVTVCDHSEGPFRGAVYVLWSDDRSGHLDIWFKSSMDRGNTWSEAIRINDDSTSADQFLPWLAIDQTSGHLHAVFYDRRHDEKGASNHVYWAWSKDAGQTWVNERLTAEPFVANERTFMGDYNNISVWDGVVRPIWVELREGRKELWTALINMHKR